MDKEQKHFVVDYAYDSAYPLVHATHHLSVDLCANQEHVLRDAIIDAERHGDQGRVNCEQNKLQYMRKVLQYRTKQKLGLIAKMRSSSREVGVDFTPQY